MKVNSFDSGQPQPAGETHVDYSVAECGPTVQEQSGAPAPMPQYNDALQAELNGLARKEKRAAEARQGKFRRTLSLLKDAGEPVETSVLRLKKAKFPAWLISKFKVLLISPDILQSFLDGKISWDEAVVQANRKHPSRWTRTEDQLRVQSAKRFLHLLIQTNKYEYVHPKGTFRVIEKNQGLLPEPK